MNERRQASSLALRYCGFQARPFRIKTNLTRSWEPLRVSSPHLVDWLDAAQEAARRGAAVLEDWRRRFTVREKARFDLVTEADLASQRAIQDFLHQQFPDHDFLGEESSE